jgi:hypothetical protein
MATHNDVITEQQCESEHKNQDKNEGAERGPEDSMSTARRHASQPTRRVSWSAEQPAGAPDEAGRPSAGAARMSMEPDETARARTREQLQRQHTGIPATPDGVGTPTPVTSQGSRGSDGARHEPHQGGAASEGGERMGAEGTGGASSVERLHPRGLGATGRSGTGGRREKVRPAEQQPEWRRVRARRKRKKRSDRSATPPPSRVSAVTHTHSCAPPHAH